MRMSQASASWHPAPSAISETAPATSSSCSRQDVSEPRRATYLDHVPVDRWMELIITPVPVPTLFGGTEKCMLMTFHDQTPLRRVEEMRADFVANASHELRTPLAALSGFIDTLQGPARDDAKPTQAIVALSHSLGLRASRRSRLCGGRRSRGTSA